MQSALLGWNTCLETFNRWNRSRHFHGGPLHDADSWKEIPLASKQSQVAYLRIYISTGISNIKSLCSHGVASLLARCRAFVGQQLIRLSDNRLASIGEVYMPPDLSSSIDNAVWHIYQKEIKVCNLGPDPMAAICMHGKAINKSDGDGKRSQINTLHVLYIIWDGPIK